MSTFEKASEVSIKILNIRRLTRKNQNSANHSVHALTMTTLLRTKGTKADTHVVLHHSQHL